MTISSKAAEEMAIMVHVILNECHFTIWSLLHVNAILMFTLWILLS